MNLESAMRSLLLCLLFCAPLACQPSLYDASKGEPGARHPSISGDGQTVVFSLWGDLWRWEGATGPCIQLTRHFAHDTLPEISPDGRQVAFSSDREGSLDVHLIDIDGGEPRRLTWHSGADLVCGWSEDGQWIYFTSQRGDRNALWRIASGGGTEELVLDDDVKGADANVRQGHVVYASGSVTPFRRGYRGSANEEIYLLRAGHEVPDQLTEFDGNDRGVLLLAGGDILFTREVERRFNFYLLRGLKERPRQLTDFDDIGAEEPGLSCDGQWLVYQRRHYLYRVKVAALVAGEPGELVKLDIRQDTLQPQIEQRTFTEGVSDPHLSDNGKVLVFVLRGAIWVCAPDGGEARQVTEPGLGDARPRVSPDGRTIAFQSTRSGNSDLWLMDVDGRNLRQFTTDAANDFFHNWSPDGQSLVFCSERSGNRDIWLQELGQTQARQLTQDPSADDDPSFSPDGKLIAYDSHARGNADIWVMNADGTSRRFVLGGTDTEQSPLFSRDGRMLYFERYVAGRQRTSLYAATLDGANEMLLAADAASASLTPDGETVLFAGQKNGRQVILAVPAPITILGAREVPVMARASVDLAAERVALFNEAWDKLNTRFYDPKFHGVDWPAVKARYLPLVARSRTIEELYYYIWMTMGELSASHMGVFGRRSTTARSATADLGARLEAVKISDGRPGLKIAELESGGPLQKAWARAGDVILGVNGRRFEAGENMWSRFELVNAQSFDFRLWISADGAPENIREVALRAENSQQAAARRYQAEMEARRRRVSELGQGRMAYIHLTAMDDANLAAFRAFIARDDVRRLDGLIIDSRGNRGGLSYMQILELLAASPYLQILPRTREAWQQPRLYWDKPVVVLCDERSNSGGECFPWAMKTLKRGKVVGERTPGNVIGTAWESLSDGSTFGIPTEGYFSMDRKRNLENDGVEPDVRVVITPEQRIRRQDPQLAEAIKVLKAELPVREAAPALK